ncbi:thioesterase family protein [Gordonia sp. NPDC003424]
MSNKLAELLTLTEVARAGDDRISYQAFVDPVFTIGPKVHGGSLQMVVAHAARSALTALGDAAVDEAKIPVAISSDYLTAPAPAELTLDVTIRKRGRTVTVMSVDAVQDGRTMVSSSVTLTAPDTGPSHHSAPTLLDATPAEPTADSLPLEGSPMEAFNHLGGALHLVLDHSAAAFSRGEKGDPVVRGWARPRDAEPDEDFAVLVGDISLPVVANIGLAGWAPTVQLTTYVRRRPAPGWLRFAASSIEIGPGMFEEDHLVVDSEGTVIAQSRQLALIPKYTR